MREVQNIDWVTEHKALKQQGFIRFEYLTAAHISNDEFEIFSKVSNADYSESVLLNTTVINEVQTLIFVYVGAAFHERETSQMFGLNFAGHNDMKPAFEVDFSGYPLRRDFALTTRQQTNWPGASEPDEKARRRPSLPPGVHETWSNS